MGQSGGGAKVCTLLAMPETQGLVSKAVALSGNITSAIDKEFSRGLGKYIFEKAGSSMEKLQSMPWEEYLTLANGAAKEYAEKTGKDNGMMRGSFGPVGDGIHIPEGTFFSDPKSPSAGIPLLLCSTTSEFSVSKTDSSLEGIGKDKAIGMIASFRKMDPSKAEAIYNEYEKVASEVLGTTKPIDVADLAIAPRSAVMATAKAKAVQRAPVYIAWFGYPSPLFDGRMRSPHCADISYWFRNTDLMLTHTGGGAGPRALGVIMSDALLSFMRTGNPSTKALPEWEPYREGSDHTMFLSSKCRVIENPDAKALSLLQ